MTGTSLTEMEGATLGIVRDLEPCTAYAIADCFAHSPSAFWSGSAGAIYPLFERLYRQGLLSVRSGATGKRKSKLYSLSQAGKGSFRIWLLDAERAADPGFDPLRTRLTFLHAVSEKQRQAFLTKVRHAVEEDGARVLVDPTVPDKSKAIHKDWLRYKRLWLGKLSHESFRKSG